MKCQLELMRIVAVSEISFCSTSFDTIWCGSHADSSAPHGMVTPAVVTAPDLVQRSAAPCTCLKSRVFSGCISAFVPMGHKTTVRVDLRGTSRGCYLEPAQLPVLIHLCLKVIRVELPVCRVCRAQ
jgi:hypothetical protein